MKFTINARAFNHNRIIRHLMKKGTFPKHKSEGAFVKIMGMVHNSRFQNWSFIDEIE